LPKLKGVKVKIMSSPMIGIPAYTDNSFPDKMPARFAMSRPYITALIAAGAAPVIIPLDLPEERLWSLYQRMDGVFLAGGGDMNPACYGQDIHSKTEGLDSLRDDAELKFARWALNDHKPLLGVCRGAQALNVAAGGTLIQDVNDQVPHAIRHQYFPDKPRDYVAHGIDTVSGTRLSAILGREARVNSFHHQAVLNIADGFRVAAYAPDGIVEAIEHANGTFAIGVQWHPESLVTTDRGMMGLFAAFVEQTH
jgi:putative glutamine amidotransferase